MFRPEDLKAGYLHLLGWSQSYDPANQIDASLTESESGQFYQDIHPLLTLENIRAIAPDFTMVTNPTYGFNEWLEKKTKASNINALQTIYTQKIAEKTAKNILSQTALFDGAGRINDKITNTSSLVGFEIVPLRSKGATIKIEKIGLQFSGIGAVKLYLMHSSRAEVIKEIEITRTRSLGMEWTPQTDLYLPYLSNEIDAGGSWYLVYDQNELPVDSQAINKSRDWSKAPCTTCNTYDTIAYQGWSKYMEVHPFKTESPEGEMSLWDIEDNIYTHDTNYGINLQLSVECDVTDIMLENKLSFQTVIGLQMAVDMIKEFAYNPNYNIIRGTQTFTKNELLYELNGKEGDNENSINYKLKKAFEAIKIDMTSMSRVCLPCNNRGIKYRSV